MASAMVRLTDGLLDALNQHIVAELRASHEYLAAASYLAHEGLDGMANWMAEQSDEERGHAMRFREHVLHRQGRVHLGAIPEPPEGYDGVLDVFESALEREQATTKHINDLYGTALQENDHALHIFLQWFIEEQVKEENAIQHIIDRLEMIGDDKAALVILDNELGARDPPEV